MNVTGYTIRPYSVLLLWPEYLTDLYGIDTSYFFVYAKNPGQAATLAQKQMNSEYAYIYNGPPLKKLNDAFPLLVLSGHHRALEGDPKGAALKRFEKTHFVMID